MRYPAYIYYEEHDDVTKIKPVYFDLKEDATYVADALDRINELLLVTGYEVEVKKTVNKIGSKDNSIIFIRPRFCVASPDMDGCLYLDEIGVCGDCQYNSSEQKEINK